MRAPDVEAVVRLVHAHSQSALAAYLKHLDRLPPGEIVHPAPL